jgi:hypothetical protein
MEQDYKEEIEKIMGRMTCPKDFECYKSGYRYLCKARDVGIESFLICLEDKPYECSFSRRVGKDYHCSCPILYYISKRLGEEWNRFTV